MVLYQEKGSLELDVDNVVLVLLLVLSCSALVGDAWVQPVHKANHQVSHSARNVNAFVVEITRMDKNLTLTKLDRLAKTTDVRASASVVSRVREHETPSDRATVKVHRYARVLTGQA